jgi:hypothetical protein
MLSCGRAQHVALLHLARLQPAPAPSILHHQHSGTLVHHCCADMSPRHAPSSDCSVPAGPLQLIPSRPTRLCRLPRPPASQFCSFFDVEPRYIELQEEHLVLDPGKLRDVVDANTIGEGLACGPTPPPPPPPPHPLHSQQSSCQLPAAEQSVFGGMQPGLSIQSQCVCLLQLSSTSGRTELLGQLSFASFQGAAQGWRPPGARLITAAADNSLDFLRKPMSRELVSMAKTNQTLLPMQSGSTHPARCAALDVSPPVALGSGVAAMFASTYNGQYEDVERIDAVLEEIWQVWCCA